MPQFFAFNGEDGLILVPGYQGIAGKEGNLHRSITFWLRTTQKSFATICWWGDDLTGDINDGEQNRIRLAGGKVELFARGSGRRSATTINDGNWHFIVFTYPGGPRELPGLPVRNFADVNVYVDNVLDNGELFEDGTNPVDIPEESEVVIGARPDGFNGFKAFYLGDLNEFAIYRDVLSTGTISAAYNNGVQGVDLNSLNQASAIQLWYRMGDDPGDTVGSGVSASGTSVDQSFYGRDGAVSSGITIS